MLLQKQTTLENLLVAALAARPNRTAKDLAAALKDEGHEYSLRGIYKELSRLESEEIVFKAKQVFALRLSWVVNVLAFADAAYEQYTSTDFLAGFILSSGRRKISYRFTSLRKLDLYWIQTLMALHKIHPGEEMCLWIPYQWFHLVHDHAIKQFYGALDITGDRRYHIFGMDCYLSRLGERTLPKGGKYSFRDSAFRNDMSTYYSLIGNHLITVTLDQSTTRKIDALFSRIRSREDFEREGVSGVLGAKVKASFSIEESETKCAKLRKIFSEHFGADIE